MLTDLTTVKALLRISSNTTQDAALTIWLAAADAAVKRYCAQDFEQQTYPNAGPAGTGDSGFYQGMDAPYLVLKQTPVTAIQHLYVDNTGYFGKGTPAFDPSTELFEGTDWTIAYDACLPGTSTQCSYSGIIQRIGSLWPALRQSRLGRLLPIVLPGNGNIKIAYTAGYPPGSIPLDLQNAVAQIVATFRRTATTGQPIQSEGLGQYNYTLATAMLGGYPELGSVRQLLAGYRRIMV